MSKIRAWKKLAACISIVVVGIVAYLPAVDNFFISDDFVLLTFLKTLNERPSYLLEWPSEALRATSYLYFWVCYQIFGIDPVPYYLAGILMHVLVSLLVCAVVLNVTGRWLTAWAAALFFAGYERHQEAVMWISAANDTVLTFNFLLAVLLWRRFHNSMAHSVEYYGTFFVALAVSFLALFSKEGAVALAPVVVFALVFSGASWRTALLRCAPLLLLTMAYCLLWLSLARENFFVSKGLYGLSLRFFSVYGRSVVRLTTPALLFGIPLVFAHRFRNIGTVLSRPIRQSLWFFAAMLMTAIIPYSFLLYLDHLPSRNTYLASVGLAGIVGILFTRLYETSRSIPIKRLAIGLIVTVVFLNVLYIWIKKDPQFQARSAPTLQLIRVLNDSLANKEPRLLPGTVCGFPLDPWIAREAVTRFTKFDASTILFLEVCDDKVSNALHWQESELSYSPNAEVQAAQARN